MKKIIIILSVIAAIGLGFYLYNIFAYLNVVVKFDELEPFEKQMKVYLKGYKVGKSIKVYPDKDFKNTYIKIKLRPRHINLPKNMSAKILKGKGGGYINLIYPDSPTIERLKNNVEINGTLTKDINSIISEKLTDDSINDIINNASEMIENANITVRTLGEVFAQTRDIITESRPKIRVAVNNLADTTTNLKEISTNLNDSLDKDNLKNSVDNIEKVTKNLEEITNQIDKTTIPSVNNILCETNSAVEDVSEITSGIKNTLKKRMGLPRLLFGRPITNKCN